MKKNLLCLVIAGLLLLSLSAQARHIVGGEIRMERTSLPTRYTFTLVQFWDENTLSTGNRDAQVEILFYRKKDNQLVYRATLPYVSSQNVDYQNKACAAFRSLKTQEGIYSQMLTLNPADFSDPEGYYVVWERCCRNEDINNIESPGSSGMVFYLEFPPLTISDTSPAFSFPNGQYICKGQPFTMNMAATDADGDELRYSLVTPMGGNTSRNNPLGDASPKSGYPLVQWATGISLQNVIPGNPSLKINNGNGTITVTASEIGLYVFTIQCEEYRDGRKIGLVRRDFQLLVIECSQTTPPEPIISYKKQPASRIELCPERPIELETESSPQWSYQWQRNGQNIPGETGASMMVKDTGSYSIVKSFRDKCSRDTTSQLVYVVPGTPPPALLGRDSEIICVGNTLELTANTGSDYSYEWRKGQTKIGDAQPLLPVTEDGWYYLLVIDEKNGCTATDSVLIRKETLSVTVPRQLSVQRGNSVPLPVTAQASNYPLRYEWIPLSGLQGGNDSIPVVSPTQTTLYQVQVTSPSGCVVTDSIRVLVFERMHIPDAFSPNGDGVNDQFDIYNGREQIEEIKIFNRWGEVVYQAMGYEAAWDGRYQGQTVPNGPYVYQIKTSYHLYEGSILVLY